MEQWGAGLFQGEDLYSTSLANAQALGKVDMLKKLTELTYEQYAEGFIETEEKESE